MSHYTRDLITAFQNRKTIHLGAMTGAELRRVLAEIKAYQLAIKE
ncbi:hypothetical protein ACNO5E_17595 [Vibrio parahaemolyticus]|jgi:hypothetical protein|nr:MULTISPECIES: hypothetical protein [Vibrionaceae]ANS88298.1 hypothetical protein VSVS12_04600 [Vibrio scophthalmi]MCZ6299002.1 hypothetical protein [Vibrio parahaemolyticus]MDF5129467.1 hypothetical protein [Vibrio parahaemolyticus]MDN4693188.1 hypothetical protein [Vibrio parahaemolyticus]MDN4711031.1 hypothetical protein [Vibrio parahaemolyticus]